jgi:hypothetical protein
MALPWLARDFKRNGTDFKRMFHDIQIILLRHVNRGLFSERMRAGIPSDAQGGGLVPSRSGSVLIIRKS